MKNPFEIDNRDVTELSKEDLPIVLNRFLWLEGRRLGLPTSNIETSLRLNDPDGGVDARIRAEAVDSYWIPGGPSIWQFKAGRNITSAGILEEVKARCASRVGPRRDL